MIRKYFLRLIQRSDFFRFLAIPVAFALFLLATLCVSRLVHRRPTVSEITPPVASPGELIRIEGRHFGDDPTDRWLEIDGNRISANDYVEWTDTSILARLPETVSDGLLVVRTPNGVSNPRVFANRRDIPVPTRANAMVGLPAIESLDSGTASIGQPLTIHGKNFGIGRNASEVWFSWRQSSGMPLAVTGRAENESVACSEHDFDYEYWSDQEIRVRIPDGATSGFVFVKTARGTSNQMPITIPETVGTRAYGEKKTYVLSVETDITGVTASEGNMLFVRVPIPVTSLTQRNVEISASNPEPYMSSYQGAILHQLENLKTGKNERIAHSFLLSKYAMTISVTPSAVKPYADTGSPLYKTYTAADPIVPTTDPSIVLTASEIVGKEKNPYLKAQNAYAWLLKNVKYAKNDNPSRNAEESLKTKTGDAYDMAILFAAFCRASGVPAIPVAGILVDADRNSRVHWWAEFYVENFGWIPVDPGLAAERALDAPQYSAPSPTPANPTAAKASVPDPRYFGNLSAGHIAFSRGWTEGKPMTQKGRIVRKPRFFAFQPIWEESGGNLAEYSSYWADPKVTGVY